MRIERVGPQHGSLGSDRVRIQADAMNHDPPRGVQWITEGKPATVTPYRSSVGGERSSAGELSKRRFSARLDVDFPIRFVALTEELGATRWDPDARYR